MTPMVWLMLSLSGLGLFVLALWLLTQASQRSRHAQIEARLPGHSLPLVGTSATPRADQKVTRLFWQAGIELTPQRWAAMGALNLLLPLLIGLRFSAWIAVLVALLFPFAVWLYLRQRIAARGPRIASQLPAFLEHMQRALLAGNSFEHAFSSAAKEAPEPLRPLVEQVARQVGLGASIEDALNDAALISRRRELATLALAAQVNRRYGGSPRAMLGSITQLIRQQENASRELRALTAETRFSALVLAVIPTGICAFIFLKNPGFYGDMWASPSGRATLIGAFVWQCCGVIALWRMIRSVDAS